jgi:hypothetical protein
MRHGNQIRKPADANNISGFSFRKLRIRLVHTPIAGRRSFRQLAALAHPRYAANMDKQRLLESLDVLRAEVAQADEVDPRMIAELRRLTDEIRSDAGNVEADEPEDGDATPPHGLKNWLLQLEAEHPQFSVAAGKVADALAAMGF